MSYNKIPILKNENILHFGLDELETYAKFRQEYVLEGMDFDNSNIRTFEDYVLSKHEIRDYQYKLVFTRENLPLFAYYKGDSTANIKTKDYICAYSSAFRVLWDQIIREFLERNFELQKFRRFDICLDFPNSIVDVFKRFTIPKQKWSHFYWAKWELETFYIGEKKNTANKRQIIRVYDKIADTLQKGKQLLFSEYLVLDHVTRAEIEIRQELAKNVQFHEVFDQIKLLSIFKNYLWKHTPLFDGLIEGKESLFRKRETIDFDLIQSKSYWSFRSKCLVGTAKSLLKVGICPVETLLKEWIISERTKVGLGYSDVIDFQNRISIKSHWYRNIIPFWK